MHDLEPEPLELAAQLAGDIDVSGGLPVGAGADRDPDPQGRERPLAGAAQTVAHHPAGELGPPAIDEERAIPRGGLGRRRRVLEHGRPPVVDDAVASVPQPELEIGLSVRVVLVEQPAVLVEERPADQHAGRAHGRDLAHGARVRRPGIVAVADRGGRGDAAPARREVHASVPQRRAARVDDPRADARRLPALDRLDHRREPAGRGGLDRVVEQQDQLAARGTAAGVHAPPADACTGSTSTGP